MKRILSIFICMILVVTASGCSAGAKKRLTETIPKTMITRPTIGGYYVNDVGPEQPGKSGLKMLIHCNQK